MGYIYKVTNAVNGKVYVGQTTRDIPSRWKNHLSEARYQKKQDHSILHQAMRKYGESAFVIEELERCDNDILDEREQYWIQQYDSANVGYNISLDGDYIQSFPSVYAASAYLGIRGPGGIRSVCTGRNRYCHGYRWSYEKVDKLPPIRKDNGLHPVAQYDKEGNLIKVYKKMKDAAKELNVSQCAIWSVCNGVHYYCAGYHFEYCN